MSWGGCDSSRRLTAAQSLKRHQEEFPYVGMRCHSGASMMGQDGWSCHHLHREQCHRVFLHYGEEDEQNKKSKNDM